MNIKPILFNTEMVQAILDGRKTQTRRVVKPQPEALPECLFEAGMGIIIKGCPCKLHEPYGYAARTRGELIAKPVKPPCNLGDILWVRETWAHPSQAEIENGAAPDMFLYKADSYCLPAAHDRWRPSRYMPKEAARIFLRVKDVRAERLQEITDVQALAEGVPDDGDYPLASAAYCPLCEGEGRIGTFHPATLGFIEIDCPNCDTPRKRFANLWGSTIKPAGRDRYGWDANPWVWAIEFERCEKPEGWCGNSCGNGCGNGCGKG